MSMSEDSIMGNTHSTPLQKDLKKVFATNRSDLSFPSDPLYQLNYVKPYNLNIPITPAAVTRPTSVQQVADVVKCAANAGLHVQARSGGHSYGNYSIGGQDGAVVVDLTHFQQFSMASNFQATIGAGTLLGDVTKRLHNAGGRAIAHGTCPQVGIGGHATIGGLGPTSRMWGSTLDHVLEVEVVLANGTITRASSTKNPDLFFALKGAAASFGIITEFVVRTEAEPAQAVQYAFTFTPALSTGALAEVFSAWQAFIAQPTLSRNFASLALLTEVGLLIQGSFYGTEAEYNALGLEQALPRAPDFRSIVLTDWLGSLTHWLEQSGENLGGGIATPFYAKSLAFRNDTLLSDQAITDMFTHIKSAHKGSPLWAVIFDFQGGFTSTIPQTATAYAHRDALYYLQSYIINLPFPPVSKTSKDFLDGINNIITADFPNDNLGAYAGYVDPDLMNAQREYWGSNYDRLQQIKAVYDPNDMFHNPQSVRLPGS